MTRLRQGVFADACSVSPNLQLCLDAINHTNGLIRVCVRMSQTPYDSHNPQHEMMLERLW